MPRVVCAACGTTQSVAVLDPNPTCEECGAPPSELQPADGESF